MKQWIQASFGKLNFEDKDVSKWIARKNIPMLNYVLLKGNKDQILKVLNNSINQGVNLKLKILRCLANNNNPLIASTALKGLQVKRPWWQWM